MSKYAKGAIGIVAAATAYNAYIIASMSGDRGSVLYWLGGEVISIVIVSVIVGFIAVIAWAVDAWI